MIAQEVLCFQAQAPPTHDPSMSRTGQERGRIVGCLTLPPYWTSLAPPSPFRTAVRQLRRTQWSDCADSGWPSNRCRWPTQARTQHHIGRHVLPLQAGQRACQLKPAARALSQPASRCSLVSLTHAHDRMSRAAIAARGLRLPDVCLAEAMTAARYAEDYMGATGIQSNRGGQLAGEGAVWLQCIFWARPADG